MMLSYPSHYYTNSSCLNCWYKAGWTRAFMVHGFTRNLLNQVFPIFCCPILVNCAYCSLSFLFLAEIMSLSRLREIVGCNYILGKTALNYFLYNCLMHEHLYVNGLTLSDILSPDSGVSLRSWKQANLWFFFLTELQVSSFFPFLLTSCDLSSSLWFLISLSSLCFFVILSSLLPLLKLIPPLTISVIGRKLKANGTTLSKWCIHPHNGANVTLTERYASAWPLLLVKFEQITAQSHWAPFLSTKSFFPLGF